MAVHMNDFPFTEGTEAVEFKLVRDPRELETRATSFNPEMCHQVFGEKEMIYGYHDLRVKLFYTAGWLEIYYGTEYTSKEDEVEPSDIFRKISNFYKLPVTENLDEFVRKLSNDKTFKPFGTLVSSFSVYPDDPDHEDVEHYEIYNCVNSTSGFKDFFKRLETFAVWFIDAATFIEFDDPNWNFFIIYEKFKTSDNTTSHAVVGYATVYNYYAYPSNIRPRISQVLVLPPFQSKGICAKLINAIYDSYSERNDVLDFTVEDPSENFQRVRDFVDCQRVEKLNIYRPTVLKNDIPNDFIDNLHSALRLNKKQARRVCEILRLKNVDSKDEEEVTKFRIDMKRKLNQPFQKQQKIIQKCSGRMSQDVIEENFTSDEDRKQKLDALYNELLNQYKIVISRLQSI